ncbi:hypothetical protein, partial [Treponema sp. R6D11]
MGGAFIKKKKTKKKTKKKNEDEDKKTTALTGNKQDNPLTRGYFTKKSGPKKPPKLAFAKDKNPADKPEPSSDDIDN